MYEVYTSGVVLENFVFCRRPSEIMKRILDEEEMRLWQKAAEDAAPIAAKKRVLPPSPAKISVRPRIWNENVQFPSAHSHPVTLGAYAGIDRNTADKFRKGKYPIDAALDLHGMSREQAHMALSGFVHAHYTMGRRCLLVITGKGAVLQSLLPAWLDEPGLRPFVLALETAALQHGGSGAYYILLRRKR
ncbi:MAG: DNA mismatch repair protein MutS [Alphaproteobacteria bacterium]|nr:DNA mismatch repair protein MutS [Alphaproteobacteria bacterium]